MPVPLCVPACPSVPVSCRPTGADQHVGVAQGDGGGEVFSSELGVSLPVDKLVLLRLKQFHVLSFNTAATMAIDQLIS